MRKIFVGLMVVGAVLLSACSEQIKPMNDVYAPRVRTYYVAAEKVVWDYAPTGRDLMNDVAVPSPWGDQTVYDKVRYVEYTDDSFKTKKSQDSHLGILGPIIRGVEGDTIKVVFRNNAEKPYSMHPHGLEYDKYNEGIASVNPGESFTYEWKVTEQSLPSKAEGGSKLWIYHSHVDSVQDVYDGLMGPIIVTKAEFANEDGTPSDVDKEFVNMYFVFDESEDGMSEEEAEGHLMHAINGYVFANLPGLEMKKDTNVRWHLFALGTEVDLHTPHWHGETVEESNGLRTDVVSLLPAEMTSVDMKPQNLGMWMYHCHVTDHITAGMTAMYQVLE